jgi:hypothetical protein
MWVAPAKEVEMITKKMSSLMVAGLLAGLASSASALPILPGGAINLPGEIDPLGGTVVATTGPLVITSPTFTGTLTSTVLVGDITNPYGTGALTFTYLLTNDATSLHNIGRLTVDSFKGFLTDVSFQTTSAGIAPTFTDRSIAGDVIGFSFFAAPIGSGVFLPGSSSALLVVQTDAKLHYDTFAYVIDGSIALVPSYAPIPGSGTPEPATISIAGMGAAALLLRRRRQA